VSMALVYGGVIADVTLRDPSWILSASYLVAWYGSIVSFLVVEFLILRFVPSVRRVGVSPGGLVVDIGILKIAHPWSELTQSVRTSEKRYHSQGDTQLISRTRIVFGRSIVRTEFMLSPTQGDLLTRYLHLE